MDKGFVGGTNDPTGLTHLGAREYDPFVGRFISVDPLIDFADPQQMHGYAYGNNNPVSFSDPTGLLSCRWEMGKSTCSTTPDNSISAWIHGIADGYADAPGEMISGLWSAASNPGKAYDQLQQQMAYYRSIGMVSPEVCVLADCNKIAGIVIAAEAGDGYAAGNGIGEYAFDATLAVATSGAGAAARRGLTTMIRNRGVVAGLDAADVAVAANFTLADVDAVTKHLARPGLDPFAANDVMLTRIQGAISGGQTLTPSQINFMTHELTEKRLMDGGMCYTCGHREALKTHPPAKNYDPDLIWKFPEFGPWWQKMNKLEGTE